MKKAALTEVAHRYRSLGLAIALAAASAHAVAPEDVRVALVIGNGAYAGAPLANPANDAKAMAAALRGVGFTVIESRDASKAQMEQALVQTRDALKGRSGVGMLYYAGHGLQLDWRNYMVPVDAKLASAADVPAQTVDLSEVIEAFKLAGNRMNIVVLDACRDNPFAATATGKGLAPMDAPSGTLLAYATAPGNVAEDGDAKSGNGLYTQFLLQEIRQPGARIEDVFKRVRFAVRKQSHGRQVPWESTSLEDDFSFDPSIHTIKLAEVEREREARQALARESAHWNRVKDSKNADDFYAFLQQYPNGVISEQAQFRLDQVQGARVLAQPGADHIVALPSGRNRFALGDELVYDHTDGYSKVVTRTTGRVTFADDARVEIDGGRIIRDQMGGILLNSSGRKEPALLEAPAELAVGKRWRSAFTNTTAEGQQSNNYYDFKVVAFESITVPAGTFTAFKIERLGAASGPGFFTVLSGTAWIDPTTMTTVRSDTLKRSGGRITEWDSSVLIEARRAPRAANR